MTYQGTFVYRFFHPDGSLAVEIKGTLTAARITADRRDMLLEGWVQPLSWNELRAAPLQTKPSPPAKMPRISLAGRGAVCSCVLRLLTVFVLVCWVPPRLAYAADNRSVTASKPMGVVDLHEHPFQGKKPVEVTVGLYISNLALVEETREQFQVEGYFTVEWDDVRLAMPEVSRVSGHLRKLNPDDLWTPPLETANMIAHRRSAFELTVDDAGHLRYVERTDTTVSAHYSLRKFPFDTQTLEFQLEPFLPAAHEVTFASRPASPTGNTSGAEAGLAAWEITELQYKTRQVEGENGMPTRQQALFRFLIKRHSGFYIWKIFLPMILMASIPWAVFWYEVQDFSGQMSVPLAIILSMVAFQLAVAKDLPRVGYTTFLDAVFLTSFILVFLCIVEIVFVYVLQVKKRTTLAETIRRTARWSFPLGYAVMLLLLRFMY